MAQVKISIWKAFFLVLFFGNSAFAVTNFLYQRNESFISAPTLNCENGDAQCYEWFYISKNVFEAMHAPLAKDRAIAVENFSSRSCATQPEIMNALYYSFNDTESSVRAQAFDSAAKQFRQNAGCCSPSMIERLESLSRIEQVPFVKDKATIALRICNSQMK